MMEFLTSPLAKSAFDPALNMIVQLTMVPESAYTPLPPERASF
jgi:hypothetical protein